MSSLKKMKVITIMWGMILFGLLVVVTTFGFVFKHKSKPYYELEKNFVENVKKYASDNDLLPENKETIKIRYEDVNNNGYMDELKVEDDECEGYVLITNKNDSYRYDAYIKCDKFTSAKYKLNDR